MIPPRDVIAMTAERQARTPALVPADVAVRVARVIAGLANEEAQAQRPVALDLLEEIVVEADAAMTRLQTGEAQRGTAALGRIRNLARDALRLSERQDAA